MGGIIYIVLKYDIIKLDLYWSFFVYIYDQNGFIFYFEGLLFVIVQIGQKGYFFCLYYFQKI